MTCDSIAKRCVLVLLTVSLMLASTVATAAARRAARPRPTAAPGIGAPGPGAPGLGVPGPAVRPHVVPKAAVVAPRAVARPVVRASAAVVLYRGVTGTVPSTTSTVVTSTPASPAESTTEPVAELEPLPDAQPNRSATYAVDSIDANYTLTLTIDGRPTPVRMLGVQPILVAETQGQPGQLPSEAWNFVRDLTAGEQVYLSDDPQVADHDADGVRVAYVHRASDGLLLNLEIIRQGFGVADADYGYHHRDTFVGHQNQAQSLGKGVWRTLAEP